MKKSVIAICAISAALLMPSQVFAVPGGQSAVRALSERANGDVPGAYASWCHGGSGGRGTCTAIFRRQGRFLLAWATTQTSVNKYKVCLRNPEGERRCKRLATRKLSDETVGDVFWVGRYFPHKAEGRYGVTWRVHGKQLGPELHFKQR